MHTENQDISTDEISRGPEFADPAMWRLTVYLGAGTVKAYLRNVSDPTVEVRRLAADSWDAARLSDADILRHIENAVYDNPAMLDDYSADIIVESDRALWMPKEIADDEEAVAEKYRIVFPGADEDDIFSDFEGDTVCAYHLVNGLAAFIRRTFPGARVSCQQTVLFRRFRLQPVESTAVYVDLRGAKEDIIILSDSRLVHASTHPANTMREAQYHILNCMAAADVDNTKSEVFISGDRLMRTDLIKALREGLPMVRNTMLPRLAGPEEMPTPVIVCSTFNRSKA